MSKILRNVFLSVTAINLVVFMFIIGCAQVDPGADPAAQCMSCHSASTETGNKILGAQAGYENSGHYKGPRTLAPAGSLESYMFHGSNAAYANGSTCGSCHNHQGFIGDTSVSFPAQIGCFTCHNPHETGDFSLRKTEAVPLVDGTTSFDSGTGNLCASCHKSRTQVANFLAPTATFPPYPGTKSVSSSSGPHHGPQSDFIMGKNQFDSGSHTYASTSNHRIAANSCVTCHYNVPTERAGLTLEFGGHGFYLKGAVHGSEKNMTSTCAQCHGTSWVDLEDAQSNDALFTDLIKTAAADWDGDATQENILLEIKGMRDTLIAYFVGAGALSGATGEWERDWSFQTANMNIEQAESFWNFKYFMEDRSDGIHNPIFAAQMLYDAIENLNNPPVSAGLTLGATWPQ